MKINIFKIMTLSILVLFIISCNEKTQRNTSVKNIYKDEIENEIWETNGLLGLDENAKKFIFTKFSERKFTGNLTSFSVKKKNFSSGYTSFCGNDYFTTVAGKYEFFDNDKIYICVDSVTFSGEWKKPTEIRKKRNLVYLISKVDNKIILTNQNE